MTKTYLRAVDTKQKHQIFAGGNLYGTALDAEAARRIVAALNAVEGIPLEQLEAGIVAIAMRNLKDPQP